MREAEFFIQVLHAKGFHLGGLDPQQGAARLPARRGAPAAGPRDLVRRQPARAGRLDELAGELGRRRPAQSSGCCGGGENFRNFVVVAQREAAAARTSWPPSPRWWPPSPSSRATSTTWPGCCASASGSGPDGADRWPPSPELAPRPHRPRAARSSPTCSAWSARGGCCPTCASPTCCCSPRSRAAATGSWCSARSGRPPARPCTSRTWSGSVMDEDERPLVARAWQLGSVVEGEVAIPSRGERGRLVCIPVRWQGELVAILTRESALSVGRRPGRARAGVRRGVRPPGPDDRRRRVPLPRRRGGHERDAPGGRRGAGPRRHRPGGLRLAQRRQRPAPHGDVLGHRGDAPRRGRARADGGLPGSTRPCCR